jgi:SAM-dependent methyltransferase
MIATLKTKLEQATEGPPLAWPDLHDELRDYLPHLRGRVLNAGAGDRDISPWIDGEVTNQDIANGRHNADIHIYSPLHAIPRADGYFDAVMCNAVLEHVKNPEDVLQEFSRVLKPGGYLYLCVPFMQPEHLDPTDFQRYTKDGLRTLVEKHGYEIIRIEGVHSVYHTLAWIVHEWLSSQECWSYRLLRLVLYPWLRRQSRRSRVYVDRIASAYRVLARKPLETDPCWPS